MATTRSRLSVEGDSIKSGVARCLQLKSTIYRKKPSTHLRWKLLRRSHASNTILRSRPILLPLIRSPSFPIPCPSEPGFPNQSRWWGRVVSSHELSRELITSALSSPRTDTYPFSRCLGDNGGILNSGRKRVREWNTHNEESRRKPSP